MRDGEAQGDPGPERVAEDVGRSGREAAEDRGEVVGRPLDAGPCAGRPGVPDRPCPGRSTTTSR